MGFNVKDKNFIQTKALPAAGASAATDGFDLGALSSAGAFLPEVEFEVQLPATPNLVDNKSITIDVETDSVSNFASPTKVIGELIKVTGSGGNGGAAATKRFRLPTDTERYVRVKATVDAAGGDNTAVSLTCQALF